MKKHQNIFFNFLEIFRQYKYLNIVIPFHSHNNTINDIMIGTKGITDILTLTLEHIKHKYGNKIRLGLPLSEGECIAGTEKLVVMSNGEIIPCESYKSGGCRCKRINIDKTINIK